MKRNWRNNSLIVLVLMLVTLASCGKGDHGEHADTYICPMHPTVVSQGPSTCPVCGMDLVRKAKAGEEVEITEDLAKLLKSPNETVMANIKLIKGEYKSVPVSVEAQGLVTYDTRNIFTVPTRVGGRLEKVYLKYAFQEVTKGQKIADIYSPELITAQRELLFLLENDATNTALIDATKTKLDLLGLTNSQINTLIQKKQTGNTFAVYSPYNGYVIKDQQAPTTGLSSPSSSNSSASGMADGMGSSSPLAATASGQSQTGNQTSIIREGSYVTAGQTLFSVVNNDAVRIELDLTASQSGSIDKGDAVQLNIGDGTVQDATVDFVQPFFNQGQDFIKLRIYPKNSEGLHIGHFISATIKLNATESLWVPKEAVLDLGTEKIVFIKDKTVLKPKRVTTGILSDGLMEIKSGLASADEIAANAQFLVDSESFIKTIN